MIVGAAIGGRCGVFAIGADNFFIRLIYIAGGALIGGIIAKLVASATERR